MHDYRLPCVSLGLIIYLQTSFSRTCDVDFKDVPSKTYQADYVFEATVHRLISSSGGGGGGAAGKGSKDKSIVRFRVNEVLKGTLDKEANADRYRTISVGKFGAKADNGRCIAPLPQQGSRHVLFLRSAEKDSGNRTVRGDADAPLLPEFLLSSFPEPLSDDVIDSVRRSKDGKFARKPRVKMQTKNLTVEAGQGARVQCIANGKPRPKVNWFKDNVQLQSIKGVSFQDTKRGSALLIRRFSPNDSGIYRCQAVNVVASTSLKSTKGVYISIASSTTESSITEPPTTTVTTTVPTTVPTTVSHSTPTTTRTHTGPCDSSMDDYCLNGATCLYVYALNEYICKCAPGFIGSRCGEKRSEFDARLVSGKGRGTSSKRRGLLLLRAIAM